jgi:5-(carboxyamino)imidazole ribonucleotide synthase
MNNPFLPSADPSTWLGVMGGGQLGRMFAHAAQEMGYKVAVLEPSADCPAGQVADRTIEGGYTNGGALSELAALCSAVTTEFENVPADSLALLAADSFVAPASSCVQIAQDRILEKKFFVDCAPASKVMPAPHKTIASHADIDDVKDDLLPGILKTVRMGYDGKGQVRVRSREDVRAAFDSMGGVTCLLEKMLPLAYEVSVLTARGHDGESVVYPIAENVHRDGILFTTTVPGPNVSAACAQQAQDAARAIVAQLGYVRQHSSAVMLNILGDAWFEGESDDAREPAWDRVLALPGANLHLYGKNDPRRGRKMGHVTFVAPTLAAAQGNLRAACAILGIEP